MKNNKLLPELEVKYAKLEQVDQTSQSNRITGYASVFGIADQTGDFVMKGAFAKSLNAFSDAQNSIKMLWQHDPTQPIGIWERIYEDEIGLKVEGRILTSLSKGQEAATLLKNGVIDGLSIGYQTKRSQQTPKGRALLELELWEISLVTFPMLPEARVGLSDEGELVSELAALVHAARAELQA